MKKILLCLLLLSVQFIVQAQSKDACVGIWLSENKDAKIDLFKSGDKYFGKLVWLKDPLNSEGKPKLDVNNPDKKLQVKPLFGHVILRDLQFTEENTWENGKIYDPKNGKSYSCKATLVDGGQTLNLRGFVGFAMIGRTSAWTKSKL
jgi:uncharacterized protein (DUF2147 family)